MNYRFGSNKLPHNFCRAAFDTYEVVAPHNVYLDDDNIVEAIGMDIIIFEAIIKDKIKRMHIKSILHVPMLQANLLLGSKLLSNGLKLQFNLNECNVRGPNGNVIAMGLDNGNLYKIKLTNVHGTDVADLIQS